MDSLSNLFIALVLGALLLFYLVPQRMRWIVLLTASIVYVASFGMASCAAILFSAILTFLCAYLMPVREEETSAKGASSKGLLILGIALNVAMLLYLKYTGFFLTSFNKLFSGQISVPELFLPAGISYYTLQTTGYLIDVYRGTVSAESNPFRYLLFVLYFPQIAQGPIGRFPHLHPQLMNPLPFSAGHFRSGMFRIAFGLFKKMLLADWLAVFRTAIFSDPERYAGIAIFGVALYSLELYGNFSGGIDMMRGISELFGVVMDENFSQPYFSTSIGMFWKKWHMSLGNFFRNYVYIPLGGNRKGTVRTAIHTFVVFFLSGLWHGASWAFVTWGVFHGVLSAFSVLLQKPFRKLGSLLRVSDTSVFWNLFRMARTFALISFGWYFFCVTTWEEFVLVLRCSVTHFAPAQFLQIPSPSLGRAYTPYALLTVSNALLVVIVVSVLRKRGVSLSERIGKLPLIVRFLLLLLLVLPVPLFAPAGVAKGFVYAAF